MLFCGNLAQNPVLRFTWDAMTPTASRRAAALRSSRAGASVDGAVVMQSASTGHLIYRHDGKSASRPEGFSLLEMMMVITVILIVASIIISRSEKPSATGAICRRAGI